MSPTIWPAPAFQMPRLPLARRKNRWLATAYIEFFRGLPALLVIIFFWASRCRWLSAGAPPGGLVGAGIVALDRRARRRTWPRPSAPASRPCRRARREAARSLGMSGSWTHGVGGPAPGDPHRDPAAHQRARAADQGHLAARHHRHRRQTSSSSRRSPATRTASTYANVDAAASAAAFMYLVITLPLTQLVAALERRQQRAS